VLAMVALFIPHAQVIITPERDIQTVTLPLQADPSLDAVFITGNIPSRTVRVTVDGNQEALGTGKVPIPQAKAKGVVTFRNLTEEAVGIPIGTVLTSTGLPGVRFLTVESGELVGGLKSTVDVPIEAESAGASGNVEAGTILAIEGNLGLLVTVTNAEPATGGSDRMTDAATQADRARLREDLLAELETQALKEMAATLTTGDQIFSDTLKMERILDENYDPPLGQPGREVKLSMQVEFTASYASGEDLTELASTVLNASLPEGLVATDASIEFEPLTPRLTDEDGITRWSVRVSRQMERQLNAGKIIPLVQGRSLALATTRLNDNLHLAETPEIRLTPDWWPWLPLIPFNITVETR
jgi:hypothetical protein